jgi:hypothetical protein
MLPVVHNMSDSSLFSAKWRKLLGLSSSTTATSTGYQTDKEAARTTEESEDAPAAPSQIPEKPVDNAKTSPLLRLPAELRNQIYSYLDFGTNQVIEVTSLSTIEYNVLDASGVPLRHNPYNANNQVWFRFEQAADEEFSVAKLNIDTRRKRCASVQGLFVLPRVCRQIRADTMLLHFAGPSFAFSDRRYNYAKAMPGFLQALSAREKKAVRSIYWPLRQAREFYHCGESGKVMTPPDKAFQTEFGKLPNLERVVLRYVATDVGSARLKGSDLEEYQALIADVVVGERYRAENVFRRELAMRGMRRQLSDREGLTVECEQTKKAAF